MTVLALLRECADLGIRLAVREGRLVLGGETGRLSDELKTRLREHRDGIIGWLQGGDEGTRIVPVPPRAHCPLSFAQQRLWFVDQLEGDSAQYNVPMALRLRGRLDVDALQASLDAIVARHAVLRTVFTLHEGEPVQVVRASTPVSLSRIDLSTHDAREEALQVLAGDEAARPFDLGSDPMLRCALVRLGEDEHAILFTMHHIASDGWSLGVLVREFVEFYGAAVEARAPVQPVLPVQYTDFACWQRESVDGGLLARDLAYWCRRLEALPPVHALPLDRPRPAQQRFDAERHVAVLPVDLVDALKALGQAHGATLFMVLQAAFAALLARVSGEPDVVMGVPHAGRNQNELAPLIGFFVNTLVFRTRVDEDLTVAALLDRARQDALDAFTHSNVPLDLLGESLRPERSLAYNPLFQIKFVLQNLGDHTLRLPGLEIEPIGKGGDRVHFDLDLTANETGSGLHLSWTYKEELFDRSTIESLSRAYARLLQAMVERPDARVLELPLAGVEDADAARRFGRGPVRPEGRDEPLPQAIAAQCRKTPDAVAVRCEGEALTYGELERRSNRLANALVEQGMGPGARVGVQAGRSTALIVALLAVMKSGAAYVMLDTRHAPARLKAIADDAGIATMLIAGTAAVPLPGVDTIALDGVATDADWLSDYPDEPPAVAPDGEASAYVLYTSGSTGRPKGVDVPHRGLADYCASARESYYTGGLAGSLVVTSPAFDLTVPALYVPLLTGGTVELMPEEDEVAALAARLMHSECPPSLLRLTPSHAVALLHLLDATAKPQAHTFVIGGETLGLDVVDALQARFPHARLFNHYGPTETVVGCACLDVTEHRPRLSGTVPVGRPMANTELLVLDGAGQPSPVGIPGELYIGGLGVAHGYVGRPDLTQERFVAHPLGGEGRMYRSGDRVRWRHDGLLEFLGRVDEQVKLRGHRIEPGEIENRLRATGLVREAAVRVIGEGVEARLVGYLVTDGDAGDATVAQVRAALEPELPPYMQPADYVVLERLPLTPNGKVDRRALPKPAARAGVRAEASTDLERMLLAIWQRVLRRDDLGIDDDFFAAGGHSLLATRVVGELGRELGRAVPVRAMFEHATVRRLADHLDGHDGPRYGAIARVERDGPLPLSFAQQRLWFLDRLEGSAQYHMPSALRLSGELDLPALEAALADLVARHEILRTRYVDVDGEPAQHIDPPAPIAVRLLDLRDKAAGAREARLQAIRREESTRPFDLATQWPIRCTVVRLGERDNALLLTLHHIASDGWSNGVLAREFAASYEARRDGRVAALPALPVQYADYAAWQRARLQGEVLATELGYWSARLAGIPTVHSLPLDHPRPPRQDFEGRSHYLILDASTTAALRTLCRKHGVTLFTFLQAAFALLLGRWSRETDIVVGTPVAGRVHRDLEGLIGLFLNTLVLRNDLSGNPTFVELLAQCRAATIDAYAHQEVPFEMLVDELKPTRSLSHNPLAQILLNVFEAVDEAPAGPDALDVSAVRADAPEGLSKADLTLYARPLGERLFFKWSYRTSLFEAVSIERMATAFETLLWQILARPEARLDEYALIEGEARTQVLALMEPATRSFEPVAVHERIAALAAARPSAIAVRHGDRAITFGDLDMRARALAGRMLAEPGVAGTPVAVLAERGIDYVTGVLAALYAGSAYVPLAVELPDARLDYMVRASGARTVLAQQALAGRLSAGEQVHVIDADIDTQAQAPVVSASMASPSHILFTSGSTGLPKGVIGSHGSLLNRVAWMHAAFPFAEDEVCCLITSTAFVRAVWELFVPLAAGCPLVVVDSATVVDLEAFAGVLAQERVTRIVTAPSLARALLELPGIAAQLARLRYWFVSGEPLKPDVAARIRATLPHVVLCNLYGSTETMSDVSAHRIESATTGASHPIGRAIDNCGLLVLDDRQRPVPPGVPGEICVSGANLALGYLGREELTAEKFVRHELGTRFGERLYRTGDLGRLRPDGTVECLGRLDYQVKVRGFRIELGEIETRLIRSAWVKDAAVLVRGEGEHAHLVAYVVPETDVPDAWVDEVRAELRGWLPDYMQPSMYVPMAAFPLTANGKVDRRALPEPAHVESQDAPPATPTEHRLAALWEELLGIEAVGRATNFFHAGGHSLLATRLASAVAARTGRRLPVRAIFEHPVLCDLAAIVDALEDEAPAVLPPAPRDRSVPLSLAQQRLWFVDRFEGSSVQYNLPLAMRIDGALDVDALQGALEAIVARHEVLRTTYEAHDGAARQVIHARMATPIRHVDLSTLDADAQQSRITDLARIEARAPFDLATDPMLRATLLTLGSQGYVLLFTMHHIASDGWSKGVIVREFVDAYEALHEGRPNPLAPLAVQYADYAHWQRSETYAEAMAADLSYWRAQLAELPAVHGLPLDRPRPAKQAYEAERVLSRLDRDRLDRLYVLAHEHDATLFMLLHAAFAILMARWSDETDIVIGTPVAGRTRKELEPLIGCFVNSLTLRLDLSGDPSFEEVLRRSRQVALDAFAHQTTSFDTLVEVLRPERHLSHGPLYQVVMALQNHERHAFELPGLRISALGNEASSTDLDLHLAIVESEEGLQMRWLYATSIFDRSTIERMAASFDVVLDGILATPEAPVASLDVLPPVDRVHLAAWSAPAQEALPALCAHELFEAHAQQAPDAVAAVADGAVLTYGELDRRANRIAHYLHAQGVGPDTRVGLCVERSLDFVTGVVGILKAGAAYVPLDPSYPEARLAAMLADAGVEHVVTQSALMEDLPVLGECRVLPLDGPLGDALLGAGSDAPLPRASTGLEPDHLAYVIYTSGSTGTPKGSMLTHRGLVNLARNQQRLYGAMPGSRVLAFASISFDGATWEWLMALAAGASLHICPEDVRRSGPRLSRYLVDQRITHAAIPPALLAQVPVDAPYALEVLIVSGEACDERLAWRWAARCRVCNSYGPSEATVAATHAEVRPGESITLGTPLSNVEVHVVGPHGRPQPIGVAGELCLAGAGLARGYIAQPELTAARFAPLPLLSIERAYRTGDRGRWLPDGQLQFLGRIDDQVKLRGFRIELGEIGACLLAHPDIADAVVVVDGQGTDARLACCVVAADAEHGVDADALRAYLRERLPDYMVPAAFMSLDALPLTRNGKLDRRALPAPDYSARQDHVEPEGELETRLAGIWARVLGHETVGATANFFDIGGHSLLATQVVSQIAEQLEREVPIRALFEHPTVRTLAAHMDAMPGAASSRITHAPRDGALPLSFSQQRLWFIDQLEGGSSQYNMRLGMQLTGPLDRAALQYAIDEVVARHEVLRTTFATHDGEAVQVIHPAQPIPIRDHDLSALEEPAQSRRVMDVARDDATRPFDLTGDFMLRCSLLRLGGDRHVLLFATHHIASDGWSMNVLGREFVALYDARRHRRPHTLAPLPLQYADFAHWQRSPQREAHLQAQLAYWRDTLRDLPPVHGVGLDRPRPARQSFHGAFVPHRVDGDTLQRLKALATAHDASLFMALEAVLAVLIGRWSDEDDIVIGTPIAGRRQAELEPLIGFFINSLVLRTDLSGDPSFATVLERTRRMALDAYAHQDVPFEMLVETLRPERTLAHSPLFQISFTFHNHERSELRLPGLEIAPLGLEGQLARYDIEVHMTETDAGLHIRWVYATSLFDAATIERLAEGFDRLLRGVVEAPDAPVHALPLLSADTARALCAPVETVPIEPVTAHALFERWVPRQPDAVAVCFEDRTLSYRELDGEANRLAHYLRQQGAGPGSRIGVCLERSAEMIIALLGAMKAGAAYVPLDPAYPEARLQHMLADSGVEIVLTQSAVLEAVPSLAERTIVPLDPAFREALLQGLSTEAPLPGSPDDAAYVIYTSGSTGTPKGVVLEHRGLVNLAIAQQRRFDIDPSARVLQFSSLSFDASTWDWLLALAHGASLHVCPAEARASADALGDFMAASAVTHALIPPAMLAHVDPDGAYGLRVLVVGGEACEPSLAWRWAERCRVANAYGPSENTVVATCGDVSPGDRVTLGTALPNCTALVLNRAGQVNPVGVAGELYVGGASLARGYLGRDDLTAARFIELDVGDGPQRVYRTGDRVRRLGDGRFEFLGRFDDQVKVRGFRIELGEIEAALSSEADVAEAIALVRSSASGGAQLVAYVVPAGADTRTRDPAAVATRLRAALRRRLPDYMVPSAVVVLDQLPLSPSGKVDRAALPAPEVQPGAEYVAPDSDVEVALAAIWAELLELESSVIGSQANFFELGGHSILAIKLVAQIRARFDVPLTVRDLFRYPSLGDLAAHLDGAGNAPDDDRDPLVELTPAGDAPTLFCVPAAGLTAGSYRALAGQLRGRFAVQVFEPAGADGRSPPATTIADTVDANLDALRRRQPDGPYRLLGHSYGGAVAFEMACRLEAEGHDVELVLLDSPIHLPESQRERHSTVNYLRQLLGADGGGGADLGEDEDAAIAGYLARRMGLDAGAHAAQAADIARVFKGQLGAYGAYRATRRFNGPTHVLLARDGALARRGDDANAAHFAPLLSGLYRPVSVSGGHLTVLSHDAVIELADAICIGLSTPQLEAS